MEVPRYWRIKKQRYTMTGEVCPHCDAKLFPPRDVCPHCLNGRTGEAPPDDSGAVQVETTKDIEQRVPVEVTG